jgi:hypothetical protein
MDQCPRFQDRTVSGHGFIEKALNMIPLIPLIPFIYLKKRFCADAPATGARSRTKTGNATPPVRTISADPNPRPKSS